MTEIFVYLHLKVKKPRQFLSACSIKARFSALMPARPERRSGGVLT